MLESNTDADSYRLSGNPLEIMHDARRRSTTPAERAIADNVIDYIIGVWALPLEKRSVDGLRLVRRHCINTQIWQAALGVTDNE